MVVVTVEGKPEMPDTVLIPREQVAVMVPKPSNYDKKYELFADDDVPMPKAGENKLEDYAVTPKSETKAKLPDETVSSSKSKTDLGENQPMPKAIEEEISNPPGGGEPKVLFVNNPIKPKPKKKRGRPKKKKG
jgi:hypothetical protein